MKPLKYIVLILAIIAGVAFWGCHPSDEKKQNSKETIKIGAILPLTGRYADFGHWTKAGLMLAAEELNHAQKDYEFSIFIEDAKSEVKDAISAYNKLINMDEVKIVLASSSSFSLAIKPKAIEDDILFFSIASHPEITVNNNGKIFRPCNTSVEEGELISNYILETFDPSHEKAYILYYNSEFGLSFKDQFSNQLGNMVIGSNSFEDNPEAFKTIALKTISQNPDVVIAIGFTPSLGVLIKTLRDLNYKGKIVSNVGFLIPSVIKTAGEAAKGVLYVDYKTPTSSKHFTQLDSLSQQRYKTNFASISYLAYFTMKLIDYSISQTLSTEINDIAAFLNKPQVIILDEISMTTHENGNILPGLEIKEFQ